MALAIHDDPDQDVINYINSMNRENSDHPLILDADDLIILAHGKDSNLVGSLPSFLTDNEELFETITNITSGDRLWMEYSSINPNLDIEQLKRTLFVERDGYLFASGYNVSPSVIARETVQAGIGLYREHGTGAFEIINTAEYPAYAPLFVLDDDLIILAHSTNRDVVGLSSVYKLFIGPEIASHFKAYDTNSLWVRYSLYNPSTGMYDSVRELLVLHGNYIFGSGHTLTPDIRVQGIVNAVINDYRADSAETIDDINSLNSAGRYHPFILNATTHEVVADGAYPENVGTVSTIFENADRSSEEISDDLDVNRRLWIEYLGVDPRTDDPQYRRAWLVQRYGLIFASGYELSAEQRIISVVNSAIKLFDSKGPATAFAEISNMNSTDPVYPFVISRGNLTIVAHGAAPGIVGSETQALRNADKPLSEILDELDTSGSTTIEYSYYNPEDGFDQDKRSYLVLHEGYIFGSGYTVTPEIRSSMLVQETIQDYQANGTAVFDRINQMRSTDSLYPFVLNATTLDVVAEGAYPSLVNSSAHPFLFNGNYHEDDFKFDLSYGEISLRYPFENPATGTVQEKRVLMIAKDGYLFGTGYYIPSRTIVEDLAELIRNIYDWFPGIVQYLNTPQLLYPGPTYYFVLNTAMEIVSNAGDSNPAPLSTILQNPDRPNSEILDDLRRNNSTWVEYTVVFNNMSNIKHTHLILHDELIFGSGYYLTPDIRAQNVVDDYVNLFRGQGKNATVAAINGLDSGGAHYPFIVNPANYTVVADGSDQNLEGSLSGIFINGTVRTPEEIKDALSEAHQIWVLYDDPDTETDVAERIWLLSRFGYIFGSGYPVG